MSATLMTHEDYTVAWICALPLEAAASKAMFDKIHPQLSQSTGDDNAYTLGEISGHNIVLTCLPSGVCGIVSAATVAAHMRITFPSIRFGLMVGIGGGVPSTKNDIRLGDVVISKPTGVLGTGVVHYDYGKTVASGVFKQTGMMNQPPQVLLNAITQLHADEILGNGQGVAEVISNVLNTNAEMKSPFSRPADKHDKLFNPAYDHPHGEDLCLKCDKRQLIHREPRTSDEPKIHYGLIASGNQVMKHGKTRDRLAKEHGMLCFEMEAAGLMNQLPCLVIRGICDYSDSHKNKQWQGYAALTAAAYAKILLSVVSVDRFRKKQTSQDGCWMVPFKRNPRFLGRHNEVVELEQTILSNDEVRKMAIAGLGGVGKTQIALEVAYRVRDRKSECSIFWVPSTSIEMIEQAYMSIGKHLGLHGVTPAEMKVRVKAHLSSEKAGPWLLIADNVDDMNIWLTSDGSSPALNTYLPESKYGFVLFTSRNRQIATKLVGPNVIDIPQMDDKIATDLLRALLIHKCLANDHKTTTQLLRQLSCLPLAITQAASYINETEISVTAYLSLLESQENVKVELLSQNFEDGWRYAETNNSVAATWLISFDQIRRLDPLAANYLLFMSCIDPRDIPLSLLLLPPDSSQVKQQKALGLLKAYSFITGQVGDKTVSLHRLVHVATRNWLRSGGMLEQWTVRTGKRLKDIFPSNINENRVLWREYLPHALFILQSKEFQNDRRDREHLVQQVAKCLYSDGRYDQAGALFKEVLEKKSRRLKNDDEEMLDSMGWMASTYQKQGRWMEAENLDVQLMETRKTVLGPRHPSTLTSMSDLACTYRKQGRWTEAEKLFVRVIETRKAVLGSKHPDTLTSMVHLACTYRKQGRWPEAQKLFVQVVETRKTVLGPEHPDTLTSMADLACTYRKRTYRKQGRWTEAEKLFVQVIETSKTVLGPEHPDTLNSMNNLALTYLQQRRLGEAEKLFMQVMATSKTVLGPDHPSTLTIMWNLSHTLKHLRRHAEALSILQDCVQLRNQRLGPSHPETAAATAALKRWQKRFKIPSTKGPASTSRSSFSLRSMYKALSCVHGAIESKKER